MFIEMYIPTGMPVDKPIVAYRSLGKLRDQRMWDDHNKFERVNLYYTDPSELCDEGVNTTVYMIEDEGTTKLFTNPEEAAQIVGDPSKVVSVLFDEIGRASCRERV